MRTHERAYRFGEFTLEADEHRLLRNSDEVLLRPKAFETLLCLVQRHGHTVAKSELLDSVWPGTFVSEAVLTHCIAEVRQALQDDPKTPRFLKTLPKVGYAFVASVEDADAGRNPRPALEGLPRTPPASAIAVLPFANLSADPGNEYFCDGLSEELINGLTKVRELRVVAHSSSFAFRGRDVDVREIGRQLGVGSILEGSVRRSGDRLRVSAQLIDTAGGYHLWSEQYDRRLEDVFAVQDEISRAILRALKVELLKGPHPPVIKPSTASMEAYLLYLQGRAYWHKRYSGFMQKAMECFEKAASKDPGFALAYSGLADTFGSLGVWAFRPPHDVFPRAGALAGKALELDPMLAEAHASQALVRMFYEWDWRGAEASLARALELNPGSALTHLWTGHLLSIVGRSDEAIVEILHAQALDPLSPIVNANVGWTFYLARQHDRAIEELSKVLAYAPGNGMALFYLGFAYAAVGRRTDAIRSLRAALDATGGIPWAAESIGWLHAQEGNRDEAHRILLESLARMTKAYVPSSAIAWIHLGLGDNEAAFEWLARCVDERDALMPWVKHMPGFDPLRADPRYHRLLEAIGLA